MAFIRRRMDFRRDPMDVLQIPMDYHRNSMDVPYGFPRECVLDCLMSHMDFSRHPFAGIPKDSADECREDFLREQMDFRKQV
eukprot:8122581-Pyramimonas_sp.AAC.1